MRSFLLLQLGLATISSIALSGCNQRARADARIEEPETVEIEHLHRSDIVAVDRPEQFPVVAAKRYDVASELNVTGTVNADVSRSVPVISLASGRVIEIDARLGDQVKKGQLLFRLRSTDIAQAFSDYRKAVASEQLTKVQLDRAKTLYDKGAIAAKELEVAKNAEESAKVDLDTTAEHLRALGSDLNHPTGIVDVFAPVSGVITDQQITGAAGVQALTVPNPFTISDLSHVWIICDVYENNLAQVRLNEYADIRLTAYPNRVLKGKISNISPILDPSIRTGKVRLEVENPGLLRLGMFVTATFHGTTKETHVTVPATAVLHLHDRDWVYVPEADRIFRRVEVQGGVMIGPDKQEIASGLRPGDKVVADALDLQNASEQ
jgi:cobalt-zinc-cadmium efflux system membrane fusion protein